MDAANPTTHAVTTGPVRLNGMFLGLFLVFGSVLKLWSSDFYLPRFGPPPLRFTAQSPKAKAFVWPVRPNQSHSVTNHSNPANTNLTIATGSSTNVPVVLEPAVQTNNVTETTSETTFSSLLPAPAGMDIGEPNPLSASNLLIITP